MISHEAMIAGGGIAGASLAILLAQSGRDVVLIEKSAGAHDKVCGEFLSDDTARSIEALGVSLESLGALPVSTVRLIGREPIAELKLPHGAMAIARRVLDEALIARAAESGATVLRGSAVERMKLEGNHWRASLRNGASSAAELTAGSAFLATGKHDLFGHTRARGDQNDLVGFKMYLRLQQKDIEALHRYVDLVLFPDGYCGLSMIDASTANFSLLIRRCRLAKLGGKWDAVRRHICLHSPYLHRRLQGSSELLDRPLAISSIPFGQVVANASNNLWRVGDQAAVIPSFTGGGMAIAMDSARLAAEMYLANCRADEFQRHLHSRLRNPVRIASVLSQVMAHAPSFARAIGLWPRSMHYIYEATRLRSG